LKKILILYPHFPPSNLAGVHRARLFAQHLPSFGWQPTVLTVHENFYEEKLDYNLEKLLPTNLRIVKTNAYPLGKRRVIGDIGLRAFFQLNKEAKTLIKNEKFDFLFIPIPSFYCALLGRMLHSSTNIKYGIDYIDPWVHHFPGSEKVLSRHWFSTKLAKFLEPIAVKKASLITGVAIGYYQPVLDRSPHLKNIVSGAMPYGGEIKDHKFVSTLKLEKYLFEKKENKLQLVYAGAMLPKAYQPLEKIFKAIVTNKDFFSNVEIHFIGTGKTPNDLNGYNIKLLAEKYDLFNDIIFEYPTRIGYLDVLMHLEIADAAFVLGSTESHYTPSKVYQAILSQKPLFAVLHKQSTAVDVINQSSAGCVLSFDGEGGLDFIEENFIHSFQAFKKFISNFNKEHVNMDLFNEYSAYAVTKKLASLLDKV
jgi:hypothetical protein